MSGKNNVSDSAPRGTLTQRLRNQSGQVLIESLLLMVISLSLLGVTLKYFQDQKTMSKLTEAIWSGVAQMAEYGNWPNPNAPVHPNSSIRARILDPK